MNTIKKLIDEHCKIKNIDLHRGFDELLDYLIELFDYSVLLSDDVYEKHLYAMKDKSEQLFIVGIVWMDVVAKALEDGSWFDFFGELYEGQYQTKGKSSGLGQFFTPKSVSDLIGKIVDDNEKGYVNDCACGSGRLLLSHFSNSKNKEAYYIGEDLDITSVKMCALNMMIHGMRGKVVRHDTLKDPVHYDYGFEINEVRYPMFIPYYSLRKIQRFINQ